MAHNLPARAPVAITPENMRDALREADDFGHEVRVRTLLEHSGGKVAHGWTYLDPALGKTRQFDLRCEFKNQRWPRFFQFAVECKNLSLDAPLIVTGVPRVQEESFHDVVASAKVHYTNIDNRGIFRVAKENTVYPVGGFVGKNIVRLRRNKDEQKLVPSREQESEIYDRWTQAVASAHDLCKRAIHSGRDHDNSHLTAIVPGIVVPDRTLWSVQYNSEGDCGTGPVVTDDVTLFLNHRVEVLPENFWMNLSHVHFWTVIGLRKFLAKLRKPNADWSDWFSGNYEPHTPRKK